MQALLSPQQAAEQIGVSVATVKTWMRRASEPLPSVQVGNSGKFRKVVAAEVPAWLAAEAARKAGSSSRGSK
jgi:transposase